MDFHEQCTKSYSNTGQFQMKPRVIRVGFVMAQTDIGWLGGIRYLSNLINAIYQLPNAKIQPVLIVSHLIPDTLLEEFPSIETIKTPLVDRASIQGALRRIIKLSIGRDLLFERFLGVHHIKLLSHSGLLGRRSRIPTIVWIPDFQHLRMPQYFPERQIAARNRSMRSTCKVASMIVVSSNDALRDLEGFDPAVREKSKVLQFVPRYYPPENIAISILEKKYGFDGPYMFLPNQFWVHKNHQIVIDALAHLRTRGEQVLILLTGHNIDTRHPGHFGQLMQSANSKGVGGNFRHLGVVPPAELAELMRNSVAVINPSFFEGWSTSVEEAKAMGKTVLLSDIPVHREQNPKRAVYFDPHNSIALADAISNTLLNYSLEDDKDFQALAEQEMNHRILAFGQKFEEIALALFEDS